MALIYAVCMAGRGERFLRAGYVLPKYMIEVAGKTLFERSVGSLPRGLGEKYVFLALKSHGEEYGLDDFISGVMKKIYPPAGIDFEIVYLDGITRGQAETALAAEGAVKDDDQLAVYNIDTEFRSETLASRLLAPEDGVIGSFLLPGEDDKWSFASVGEEGFVTGTAEKVKISDNALTGFYHFTRAADFFRTAKEAVKKKETRAGEFYIAPLYNKLIAEGKRFVLDGASCIIPLGTPEDIEKIK